ncbi:MAG TPA: hypothetical protein VGX76_07115, partial [Pirellulales bacterium]|nr:hypothetical protein [Pirellulales bacterium]
MSSKLRPWSVPFLATGLHVIAWVIVVQFEIDWRWLHGFDRSPTADLCIDSALLVFLGADLGLIAIGASLAPSARTARWLSALV